MAIRRDLVYELLIRDIEQAERRMFFQTLWNCVFIFLLLCGILTIRIPPWFGWNVDVLGLWRWIPALAVAFMAIIQEYENRWRQDFERRWPY